MKKLIVLGWLLLTWPMETRMPDGTKVTVNYLVKMDTHSGEIWQFFPNQQIWTKLPNVPSEDPPQSFGFVRPDPQK